MFGKFINAFLEGKKWAFVVCLVGILSIIIAASALLPLIPEGASCR